MMKKIAYATGTLLVIITLVAWRAPTALGQAGGALDEVAQILRDDSNFQGCGSHNSIFIKRGLFAVTLCVHKCFGDHSHAQVKDLNFSATRVDPHTSMANRAFVVIPCRRGKCATNQYGVAFGSNPDACGVSDLHTDRKNEINIPAPDDQADRMRELLSRVQ